LRSVGNMGGGILLPPICPSEFILVAESRRRELRLEVSAAAGKD
jgi:hypothetical protein